MEGSPNGAIRPNFDLSRLACMKRIGGIVFTGWALGAAIWALPASAEEKWKGTIGEPLRASSNQAIELANHLSAIGARFYGSWTCSDALADLAVPLDSRGAVSLAEDFQGELRRRVHP